MITERASRDLQLETERDKPLLGAVMEVSLDSPPLEITRFDDACPRSAHFLELRFDLLQKQGDQAPAFDGKAVFELQAGRGGSAVARVKRCADDRGQHLAETSRRR